MFIYFFNFYLLFFTFYLILINVDAKFISTISNSGLVRSRPIRSDSFGLDWQESIEINEHENSNTSNFWILYITVSSLVIAAVATFLMFGKSATANSFNLKTKIIFSNQLSDAKRHMPI